MGKQKKILDKVVECLRKSILVFMQTKEEKSTLLTLIDNALLERQADKELEEKLISKNILLSRN